MSDLNETAYAAVMARVTGNGTLKHHARAFLLAYLKAANEDCHKSQSHPGSECKSPTLDAKENDQ